MTETDGIVSDIPIADQSRSGYTAAGRSRFNAWGGVAMPARKPPDPNAKTRLERFTEVAREIGCDEDEAAFKERLGQIARYRPKDEPKSKTPHGNDGEGAS